MSEGALVIGIASKIMFYLNEPFYQDDEFENYSYNICNGYRVTQNMFEQYAMRSNTGDIIEMELNMNECTLSFCVNGVFQGIAFDDIEKEDEQNLEIAYRMALSLEQDKDEITLLDFRIISQ